MLVSLGACETTLRAEAKPSDALVQPAFQRAETVRVQSGCTACWPDNQDRPGKKRVGRPAPSHPPLLRWLKSFGVVGDTNRGGKGEVKRGKKKREENLAKGLVCAQSTPPLEENLPPTNHPPLASPSHFFLLSPSILFQFPSFFFLLSPSFSSLLLLLLSSFFFTLPSDCPSSS